MDITIESNSATFLAGGFLVGNFFTKSSRFGGFKSIETAAAEKLEVAGASTAVEALSIGPNNLDVN